MLSDEDNRFLEYWEKNRDKQKKTFKQFLVGIPIGLLFAIPICISFFSGWDKQAAMVSNTPSFNPMILIVAMLIIIAFIAIFSKKHQWDIREQHYRELLAKQAREKKTENLEKK